MTIRTNQLWYIQHIRFARNRLPRRKLLVMTFQIICFLIAIKIAFPDFKLLSGYQQPSYKFSISFNFLKRTIKQFVKTTNILFQKDSILQKCYKH